MATGLEKVSFHSNTKEGQCQRMFYHTIALMSYASKVILKILQVWLQQYVNRELPDVQAEFRKGRGTRDQIANICWIIEKAREFQKRILLLHWLHKTFNCVDHKKLWKIFKEMGMPDTLPTFLVAQTIKNLPAMRETWFWSLDWEDSLEKGMATHSSIFAWRIP